MKAFRNLALLALGLMAGIAAQAAPEQVTHRQEITLSTSDQTIEAEIQAKGLTAARVTPADIEANIASEHYAVAADMFGVGEHHAHPGGEVYPAALQQLTFCVLVLRNGFTVTGESACASPENFDAELGRKIARQAAVNKMWPLMGYALKEQLSKQT